MTLFSRLAIRTKTALVMTLILAVMSVAVYLYFPARQRSQALEEIRESAETAAELAAYSVAPLLTSHDPDRVAVAEALVGIRRSSGVAYVVVLDHAGQPVSIVGGLYAQEVRYRSIPMQAVEHRHDRSRPGEASTLWGGFSPDGSVYQASSEIRYRGRTVGKLFVGSALRDVDLEIARSRATVALVTAVAFVLGVIAAFLLSTVITGPLSRIARTSEEIAKGDLSKRATVASSDEVGQLARSFNQMVDGLASARFELEGLNRTLEQRVDDRTAALSQSEERYRLLFERNLAGAYVATPDFCILRCNTAFAKLFGYDSISEFMSSSGTITHMNVEDGKALSRRLATDGAVLNEEIELRDKDGRSLWALQNVRLVPGSGDDEDTLEGVLLDISERKRAELEMAYRAYHDVLTGLPNRSLFLDRASVAIARAQRLTGHVAVLFIDLDDLKTINDTLGHAIGDELLRRLADRLSETLRAEDTVARVGGDEFVILLPEVRGEEGAAVVARKIQNAVSNPFIVDEDEIHVTASIGMSIYPMDGSDAPSLLRNADAAMYRVKESGGAAYRFASRMGQLGAVGRTSLELQIREALERDEFSLYYQPQISLDDGMLCGAEGLVRWIHSDSTDVIAPAGFIPIAESTGLISAVGERVLYKACQQVIAWRAAGLETPLISVNVSARQFYQRDFIGTVKRILSETGVDPRWLELEITETVTMQKGEHTLRMLRRLRDLGLSIAIDDFGTGQSSLSYLKSFPIDTVKIDKSFVNEIGRRSTGESIVLAVLLLSRQLNLRSVAEGVETETQRAFLQQHDCRAIQGFLISRPVPPEEFQQKFLRPAEAAKVSS